jgi:[ribosomal protein S5]-alanine N-acetyltransferase
MKIDLRALKESDRKQIASLINNKKIWDNLRDYIPYPYSISDADHFIDLTIKQSPAITFGILKDDTELCGVIGLVPQKDIYRIAAELGYWIGEKYWGKGIATEAVGIITQYGFDKLNLERIYAGVFDFNKPSKRVLEKNGFKQEGIFRRAVIKNDIIHDEYLFAKLRSE